MAIKNRQGKSQDFVPTKLVSGEFAVVQEGDENTSDGSALYLATKTGSVKRIPFATEVEDLKTQVDDAVEDVKSAIVESIDPTLTQSGKSADAKATGGKISELKSDIDNIEPGLSETAKRALLACFEGVAWTSSESRTLYNSLKDALYASSQVISISAVFEQGTVVVYPEDSLDSLRAFLTVTATYDDGKTASVSGYDLFGELVANTSSVITVVYKGQSTTFTVNVSEPEWGADYTWLYRASEDGLLSEYENVSAVVAIGEGTLATETLKDGVLNVSAPYQAGVNHNDGTIYKLSPLTCTSGVLKAKVKFNSLAGSTYPTGLRLQLSNGAKGAQIFAFKHSEDGDYRISSHNEGTQIKLEEIEFDRWYVLSCEIKSDNTQVLKIDNGVYNVNALSSYANTESRVIVQQPNAGSAGGDVNIDIAWISFKNNA